MISSSEKICALVLALVTGRAFGSRSGVSGSKVARYELKSRTALDYSLMPG